MYRHIPGLSAIATYDSLFKHVTVRTKHFNPRMLFCRFRRWCLVENLTSKVIDLPFVLYWPLANSSSEASGHDRRARRKRSARHRTCGENCPLHELLTNVAYLRYAAPYSCKYKYDNRNWVRLRSFWLQNGYHRPELSSALDELRSTIFPDCDRNWVGSLKQHIKVHHSHDIMFSKDDGVDLRHKNGRKKAFQVSRAFWDNIHSGNEIYAYDKLKPCETLHKQNSLYCYVCGKFDKTLKVR